MSWFYNFAFLVFAGISLPAFLVRMRQAESPRQLLHQRLGLFSEVFRERLLGKKIVWLHAVSVGEVLAVQKFVEEFLDANADYHLVLSTVTPTGQKIAKKMEGKRISVCYFPFDITGAIRSFFQIMDPECLLLVETEIWPNLLTEARKRHVPVGIINARLSERSLRRYRRFQRFFRPLFQSLSFVLAQTPADQDRFIALGVDPSRVRVPGNMKFDNPLGPELDAAAARKLREEWGFRPEHRVVVAGSTHEGEEKRLCEMFKELKPLMPELRLLVAPRHIERSEKVAHLFQRQGFRVRKATGMENKTDFDVLILDQLGVLRQLYAIAEVVFVGGSLIRHGGQNPIEPAYFKKAILHGPYVAHFEFVYRALDREGGAILVQDEAQLVFAMKRLLQNPSEARELGENAWRVVQELRGAARRHVVWLSDYLKNKSPETGAAEPTVYAESYARSR